jgi:hypothetical protein
VAARGAGSPPGGAALWPAGEQHIGRGVQVARHPEL